MDVLTVDTLAEVLQEPKRSLLMKVLRTFGVERTTAILADTLTCEANGGMLTKDGTRRRTPGGVFFQLVREQATTQERWRLFPRLAPQQGQGPTPPQPQRARRCWGSGRLRQLLGLYIGIPALEHSAQFAVERLDACLQQQMCAPFAPLHLLFFAEAFAHDLVHGRLD